MTQEYFLKKYKSKIASTKNRVDRNGNAIEMRLSFEEYCTLWKAADKLPGQPYVMSRKDDLGHYEIGNVYIQHNVKNVMEVCERDSEKFKSELEKQITEYCIKTGYKRSIAKRLLKTSSR
jgi:hypothetical protein